jgi:tetratricopeptide (TPR) repeat protein
LVVAVLLLYWPVTDHDFINFDDPAYVLENPHVRAGLSVEGLRWALTTTHTGNWHPLTWVSHMADVSLFGVQPGGHHLTSALLHTLTTALVFTLFIQMTGRLWLSALLAAVFGLHPLQVESVAWVAERKNVLANLFWCLVLLSYRAYVRRPGRRRYAATLALYFLGLTAKPMIVTLPCVMVLLDHWPLGRWPRRGPASLGQRYGPLLREKIPFLLLSAGSAIITLAAQSSVKAVQSLEAIPLGLRLANAAVAYRAYIEKFLYPDALAVYYPYAGAIARSDVVAAVCLLALIGAAVFCLRRRRPGMAVGWLWFLGTLVPVIGLVQVGFQAMADRYASIPMIGLALVLLWGLGPSVADHFKPLAAGAAGLALAGLSLTTGQQLRFWQDSITLYTRTLALTRNKAPIHLNLGIALVQNGRITEGMVHYLEALQINPRHAAAHHNLGLALIQTGNAPQALAFFDRALRLDGQMAEAHVGKAVVLAQMGRRDDALESLERALAIAPGLAMAHFNLASVLIDAGREDKAMASLAAAIALEPWNAKARNNLGLILAGKGRWGEAVAQYTAALRANPHFEACHINLGVALVRLGQLAQARRHFEMALRINPRSPEARANLDALNTTQGAMVLDRPPLPPN